MRVVVVGRQLTAVEEVGGMIVGKVMLVVAVREIRVVK